MKSKDYVYPLPSKLWFTKNSEIIAEHELKKRHKYAKYTIEYGKDKDHKIKSFKTRKKALVWIRKKSIFILPQFI